jgi:hypothetical protein
MFKIGDRVKLWCNFSPGVLGVVTEIIHGPGHSEPEYRVRSDHECGEGLWFHYNELKLVESVMEKKLQGTKFEVGKTYRCATGDIAECVYAFEGNNYHCMFGKVVGQGSTAIVGEHRVFSGSAWSEYVEPKVTKIVKYLEQHGGSRFTHWDTDRNGIKFIAKVEVIHTEGVGVEYKVLEYYPPKK